MKCLLWFREKKNKESKLLLRLKGKREGMSIALEALLEGLCALKL